MADTQPDPFAALGAVPVNPPGADPFSALGAVPVGVKPVGGAGGSWTPETGVEKAERYAKAGAAMGINMVGTGVGTAIGATGGTAIAPGPGTIAGGVAGGVAGSYMAGKVNEALGLAPANSLGQNLAGGFGGFIPGASVAESGVAKLVTQGIKAATANVAATAVQTGVDEGKLPTATQVAIAAGGGFGGTLVSKVVDSGVGAVSAKLANSQAVPKTQTLQAWKDLGGVIPPYETNPGMVTNTVGSVGGKAATGQAATLINQKVTNAVAAKSIGLAPGQPITMDAIQAIRDKAAQAYEAVGSLSPQAAQDLQAWKQANFDTKAQMKFYNRSADPSALAASQAAGKTADALQSSLETHALGAGMAGVQGAADLVPNLQAARTLIAKTHVVEGALNEATGDVSAKVIGKLYDKGAILDPGLSAVGAAANAFPKYMGDASSTPAPGVSKLGVLPTIIAAATAGGAEHSTLTGLAAGLAAHVAPGAARAAQLSPAVQNGMLSRFSQPPLAVARADLPALAAQYATAAATRPATIPPYLATPNPQQ